MTSAIDAYGRFGARPLLVHAAGPGQQNSVDWAVIEAAVRGIFERRYFANNGPLVQQLDTEIARAVGIGHAVCVTNELLAGMVLGSALQLPGEAVVPVTATPTLIEALRLAGLTPVFCDVDSEMFAPTAAALRAAVTQNTRVFAAAHLFGRSGVSDDAARYARELGLTIIVDAGRMLGGSIPGLGDGAAATAGILTFDSRAVVNGAEGAAIVTDDDALAARLRTIRNFHPGETFADVPLRVNGKMSEAQAALVLAALPAAAGFAAANAERWRRYAAALAGVDGIRLIEMDPRSSMCAQFVVAVDEAAFGLSRDELHELLIAENIAAEIPVGVARPGFAGADQLARTLLELPNGQQTSLRDVDTIAEFVRRVARDAMQLGSALRSQR